MPQCYIDDQYMDECIIDSKTGKLRHCSTCEAVIQDLLDDYDKADQRRETGWIDQDFDCNFVSEFVRQDIPTRSIFINEDDEPTD